MWYALQTLVIGGVAYIYLTEVSDKKDILHAICLGTIVAFYLTVILSGVLNATLRLIRGARALLLRRPRLRRHEQPNKLIHVSGGGRTRPPALVRKTGLRPRTRNDP